jgi:hypothetical protein
MTFQRRMNMESSDFSDFLGFCPKKSYCSRLIKEVLAGNYDKEGRFNLLLVEAIAKLP